MISSLNGILLVFEYLSVSRLSHGDFSTTSDFFNSKKHKETCCRKTQVRSQWDPLADDTAPFECNIQRHLHETEFPPCLVDCARWCCAGSCWLWGSGRGKDINSLTHVTTLWAIIPTCQARCNHWYNNGKTIWGVTTALIGFEAYPLYKKWSMCSTTNPVWNLSLKRV